MRTDPFSDVLVWLFDFRWQTLLYWALLIGSVIVAAVNWRRDPAQRTPESVAIWVFRLLIGAMWYQGTTWKLPLPASEAFAYWLGETGKYAAFPFIRSLDHPGLRAAVAGRRHADLLRRAVLCGGHHARRLTRLAALLALGQATFLWIGLYQAPNEWPWNYVFLMIVHGFFIVTAAGRCLGVDALLRRPGGPVDRAGGLPGTLLRLAT